MFLNDGFDFFLSRMGSYVFFLVGNMFVLDCCLFFGDAYCFDVYSMIKCIIPSIW